MLFTQRDLNHCHDQNLNGLLAPWWSVPAHTNKQYVAMRASTSVISAPGPLTLHTQTVHELNVYNIKTKCVHLKFTVYCCKQANMHNAVTSVGLAQARPNYLLTLCNLLVALKIWSEPKNSGLCSIPLHEGVGSGQETNLHQQYLWSIDISISGP